MNKNESAKKVRGLKLYRLVEYLKSIEFFHDTFDLEDEGVSGVLSEYGLTER